MNLNEAYELWIKDPSQKKSYKSHRKNINDYVKYTNYADINEINNEVSLRKFILNSDINAALGKYSAIVNFHKFIQINLLKVPSHKVMFPIGKNEAKEYDATNPSVIKNINQASKGKTLYLHKDFDFMQFFDDKYYKHLCNNTAASTVKAAIALGLGAGYDSGEMFINNNKPMMTMEDIEFVDDNIFVTNFNEKSTLKKIQISGKLVEYITEYYNIRFSKNNISENDKSYFFPKLWDAREMKFQGNGKKPYSDQMLVLYMLKYILKECGSEKMVITNLRENMVLRSLYNSKGSSFIEIIKTFGFTPFVEKAFKEYLRNNASASTSLFNDKSFFEPSPSDDVESNIASDGDVKTRLTILNRLIRDATKVRKLKLKYDNVCQVCGEKLTLIDNIPYSEACHIQPLVIHNGIDHETNMLILCPNHHKLFDLGIFSIDPSNNKSLIHLDEKNAMNNSQLKVVKHDISPISVRYHFENIFMPLKLEIQKSEDTKIIM